MRLTELAEKIKTIPDLPKDIFILLLILLVGMGSFGLGRLSALEERKKTDLRIVQLPATASLGVEDGQVSMRETSTPVRGIYVGSRSGTTYHLPWCTGAKRIREENQVWFSSKADAEARGYKPAANCKGV